MSKIAQDMTEISSPTKRPGPPSLTNPNPPDTKTEIENSLLYVLVPLASLPEVKKPRVKIGVGSGGVVYKDIDNNNKMVAIKSPPPRINAYYILSEESIQMFNSETKIQSFLNSLNSPYIVQYHKHMRDNYDIVMEYMPNGSLRSLLKSSKPLDWKIRKRLMLEMAYALDVIHSVNIIHCDIHSGNFLLDDKFHIKLSDFGLAKFINKHEMNHNSGMNNETAARGAPAWRAPELYHSDLGNTKESDVYSLGMTFWEVAARKTLDEHEELNNKCQISSLIARREYPKIPEDCPNELSSLIQACWDQEPPKRPNSKTIVKTIESSLKTEQPDFSTFLPAFQSIDHNVNRETFTTNTTATLSANALKTNQPKTTVASSVSTSTSTQVITTDDTIPSTTSAAINYDEASNGHCIAGNILILSRTGNSALNAKNSVVASASNVSATMMCTESTIASITSIPSTVTTAIGKPLLG